MQITEKRQLPPFRSGIRATKKPLAEFRRSRLAGLIGPIQRELHELRVGHGRPLGGSASAKAGPKSSESEAAVSSISSSPKEMVSRPLVTWDGVKSFRARKKIIMRKFNR